MVFKAYSILISMSKGKGKEKKAENYEVLEKQFEEQKRELLEVRYTLKRTEERVNMLVGENGRLSVEREEGERVLSEKVEELTIKNETNEKRLITMRNDLTNAEVENKKLTNTLSLLEKNVYDERIDKAKEYQELKKTNAFEIAKYENMLTDYRLYMTERDARQKDIADLVEQREIEIANRIRDVADKEREKVQATDKIRDEMGNKIREMRQNLLSLKKEELETTTRLTMLQNHQLTSELEYQSKQTEKIVFKNQELEASLLQLKQQLEIHKQVEDELAKRSHFSKGIIKKLHARVGELEDDLRREQEARRELEEARRSSDTPSKGRQKPEKSMLSAVEKELEKAEKKYAQLFARFDALHREKEDLATKLEHPLKSKILAAVLKAYEGLTAGKENGGGEARVSLGQLRRKEVKDWSWEETRAVIEVVLVAVRPALTRAELSGETFSKIVVIEGEKPSLLPKLSTEREKILHCASENQLCGSEDMSKMVKEELSKEKYSVNIASRMVIGKVRDWGKPLGKSHGNLQRKYKLSATFRN